MKTRHTSGTQLSVARIGTISIILLSFVTGCLGGSGRDSFLPDPAPETPEEMQALVDSLRLIVSPSYTDRSMIAGTWEAMNVILTPVSVIDQFEALEIMGQDIIYTKNKAVLFHDACDRASYSKRMEPFFTYFRDFELKMEELRLLEDPIEVISVTCNGEKWDVPGAELVRVSRERLLIRWDGSVILLLPRMY
jgi:hypothetical protein